MASRVLIIGSNTNSKAGYPKRATQIQVSVLLRITSVHEKEITKCGVS